MTSENAFSPGDLVFAKIKGYPHWPAIVKETILNETKTNVKYYVEFFGDKTTAKATGKDLFSYKQNKTLFGVQKVDNFKNKKFNAALREADEANTISERDTLIAGPSNGICSQRIEPEIELGELKEKILNIDNIEETDLETSLSLAAEVGNALLTENHKLKQDLLNATLINSKLALDMEELKNTSQINYQGQLKELEDEKEIIIHKYSTVLEKLNYVETQLLKEKQIQADLRELFEEQDREKENIICKLLNEIKQLKQYKSKRSQDFELKVLKNMETQTAETHENSSSFVLNELTHLKRRQEQTDESIKRMEMQIHQLKVPTSLNNPTDSLYTTDPELNNTLDQAPINFLTTNMENKTNQITPGISQTCSQKLYYNEFDCQTNSRQKSIPDKRKYKSPLTFGRKGKNIFSVSLQVAKHAANNYRKIENPHLSATTRIAKPPFTAKIRDKNEDIEIFYDNYIDFYKIINTHHANNSNRQASETQLCFPNIQPTPQ
ncbi:negative regulation of microtubule depolymerization, partial [Homalodisca vitripennis]